MSSPSGGDRREIYHPLMRFDNYPVAGGTGPFNVVYVGYVLINHIIIIIV
jgi:hypothetical protein